MRTNGDEVEKFKVVTLDPPWNERGGGKSVRGAQRHYDLMKTKDMPAIITGCEHWKNIDETAHMYLWVTNNFLKDGLWLAEELGFRYITIITWLKDMYGLGRYYRGITEQVLFCVKGDYMPTLDTHSTIIEAARRKHSQKPELFYRMVEKMSPGPRLDMFARSPRPGWTVWGDEIDGNSTMENV